MSAFPVLEFANSDALEVGDVVLAIGDPFGVGQTVTHGIVSALARTQVGITDYQFFIQTDAAINPGNSGGALVDLDRPVWSASTPRSSRARAARKASALPSPPTWCGWWWPPPRAAAARCMRPWLGAKLQAVTADIADSMGLKRPVGALVASVEPKSPGGARRAQGRRRDRERWTGKRSTIPTPSITASPPSRSAARRQLGLLRSGREASVTVALQTAPRTPRDEITIRSRSPFSGAKVANLSPALADELQLQNADEGVVIVDVDNGSYASNLGFQRGDIIVSVNGEHIAKTRDLARVTETPSRAWHIVIRRGGQQITAVFNG